MAENRVSIIITAKNMASDALNQVRAGFNNIGESSRTFQRNLSDVNGTMSSTMSTAMRFAGIIAGGLTFNSAIQSAYSFNRTMEDTKLGLASLAYATMDFTNAQGKLLTGQEAFNASMDFSTKFQEKLRIAGLQTAATFEQLSSAVTQAWTPAVQAGFNPDQIVSFTTATTQAATAMGINLNQMGEEIRSVLTGTMTSMNTRLMPLMNSVGLTNDKLKELAKTGQLYPALMKAFEGSTLAAEKANMSLGVSFSNLQDAGQNMLGTGFKPFFDQLGASARDLTKHLYTVNDGVIVWNESLLEIVLTIGRTMGEAVKWTYEHAVAVARWIKENEDAVKVAAVFAATLASVNLAFRASMMIEGAIAALASYRSAVLAVNFSLTSLSSLLGIVGAAIAGWNIGKAIGDMELFGHSINTWVQLAYNKMDEAGHQGEAYIEIQRKAILEEEKRAGQTAKTAEEIAKAAEKETDAKIKASIAEQKALAETEKLKQDQIKLDEQLSRKKIDLMEEGSEKRILLAQTEYKKLKEDAHGNAEQIREIDALFARESAQIRKDEAVKAAEKIKQETEKIQKQQHELSQELIKAETSLIEDESEKQLETVLHQYQKWQEEAAGNADLLEKAERVYTANVMKIRHEAAEKSKKEEAARIKAVTDKLREYSKIVQDTEKKTLATQLDANQEWYDDEIGKLREYAREHKYTHTEMEAALEKLEEARAAREDEIRSEQAEKEAEALKEKVKVWDKAYESMQDTLSDFLETGKFDLKNFGKMFKSWVADLVSSWMVNTARMSLPSFLGGTAGLAAKTAQAAGQGGAPGASGATGSGSSVSAADANSFLSGMTNMTKSFGEFLSGGWAKDLGKALSDNGATSVGGWLQESGTSGILSGASGAAISAGIGSAVLTGLATGNWQKAAVSGVSTGIGAAIGTMVAPGVGTAIGAALGQVVGSFASGLVGEKYDDANLFMSIGDSSKAISEYTDYVGEFSKALYEPVRNGDLLEWVPNPNEAWSVQTDSAFMLDIRKGDSGMSGTAVKKLEFDIADYFKTIFKSIDNTFNINVRNIIRSSRIGLGINVKKFEEYLNSGDIAGALNNMTGQFFDVFGNAISSAIFEIDTGILFNTEALESMKRDSETLGETFIRVASLLQAVPEGIARLRQYMEQGLTEAEAFDKIETQYAFVSGTIANALSEAMQQGVKAADFEAFQETFATSLENQLKAAVAASFQQQILGDVITASFGSMAGFSDMLKDMHDGKITISEFKSYMQSGMAAAKAAIAESEPLLKDLYNIIDLAPKEDDTAIVQARELASSVVSGTITSALKSGIDAADWNVFRSNISTQMSEQMKNVVLNTFSNNMMSSIMASVFSTGGIDLNSLTTGFMEGNISAEQFGLTLGNATTRMEAAAEAYAPVLQKIMELFNIKPPAVEQEPTEAEKAAKAAVEYASDIVSNSLTAALNLGVEAADWNVFKNSIESQLSSQLQNIVLQTFTSNMISSVMSSVFADGGGLSGLVTDFMAGNVSADEFSATIGSLSGKMAQAADAFGPMFHNIMKALDIQPKEDKSSTALAESTSTTASATTEAALEMVDQTEAVTQAVEKFKTNSADANLMLAFLSSLVEKIPDLAESYTVLDAAIMRHREGLEEYGSGISELTTSLAGYIAEVKDVVAALESTTRAAIARASDAAASAASAADRTSEMKDILVQILKHNRKTADVLSGASDGDTLNVKTVRGSVTKCLEVGN